MNDLFRESVYFGFFLALAAYWIGLRIQKRFPYTICNPLLLCTILIVIVLTAFHIDYDTFDQGAKYITYFLTPSTVCLAIPMYKQILVLKKNLAAILISLVSGCIAAAFTIWALCAVFGLDAMIYHSLQPKSITTAIAMGVSEELGGNPTLTVAAVIITGLFGGIAAKTVCRLFRITNPIAVGLACGNSAHAIGTSKALEFGEVEGAMSSLAVVTAGVITVVLAPMFSGLIS
ncbi:LrgB family protein [Qiania dongpingensis]|uniref:LrgB family protein n=1 Tax=Qiania dongpingensis TaxID=2763669 RepID=A0A7G9G5M1_9FIRM|nr:LrgB family protein [Qiania dongpingensis]QNM06103.1 LrgB family protein [Qiania dongpingensis]